MAMSVTCEPRLESPSTAAAGLTPSAPLNVKHVGPTRGAKYHIDFQVGLNGWMVNNSPAVEVLLLLVSHALQVAQFFI